MAIPEKVNEVVNTKQLIANKIKQTGQDTNIPFRQYADLIRNIPNTGSMTYDDVDELVNKCIDISGEKA